MSSFNDLRRQANQHRTSHTPGPVDAGLQRNRPEEQRTPYNSTVPFEGGGRHAELNVEGTEFWDSADDSSSGYYGNLRRTARQNRENVGDMRSGYPLRIRHTDRIT